MSWEGPLDVLAAIFLVSGSFLILAAGIGVLRFPDLLTRMHAATKPQVLGVLLALSGLALRIRVGSVVWTLLLVGVFQMLTAPVAFHMVGRAGYRTGRIRRDLLVVDELTADLIEAQHEATSAEAPEGSEENL
ncbi:MAG: monovalent cation/H(+) antiporter subunit G [Acidimicrobiia bacterium]